MKGDLVVSSILSDLLWDARRSAPSRYRREQNRRTEAMAAQRIAAAEAKRERRRQRNLAVRSKP